MIDNNNYENKLTDLWKRSDVNDGDMLLIHSNIKRTLLNARRKGVFLTPKNILQSFINAIGDEGTLLFPLFNFDYTTKKKFDFKNTPSHMGALTEEARKHKGSIRTGHPIYSFAVLGKNRNLFEKVDNESGYGKDSPFGILHKEGGKIACLDLEDQDCMTFYHYVEESLLVDYRYFKTFYGEYTDLNGNKREKGYKIYVRNLEKGVLTNVNPTGELMWKQGLYKGDRPKIASGLRTIKAKDMYNFVEKIILSGNAENNLYIFEKKNSE